jgi:hypothetical protein
MSNNRLVLIVLFVTFLLATITDYRKQKQARENENAMIELINSVVLLQVELNKKVQKCSQ